MKGGSGFVWVTRIVGKKNSLVIEYKKVVIKS